MPWCPNCKNEYKEGITICADCGATLVTWSTELELVPLLTMDQADVCSRLADFMRYEGITSVETRETEDGMIELLVPTEQKKEATRLVQAFTSVEKEKQIESLSPEELSALTEEAKEKEEAARNTHRYVKASDRLEETKSTAYMFIGFGVALLIFTILNIIGVLSIVSGLFSNIVLLGLVAVFFFIGGSSLRSIHHMKEQVDKENDTTNKITEWFETHMTDEALSSVVDPNASEEENDIFLFDYVKEELIKAFPDLDDNFADSLVNDYLETK